MYGTSEQKEKYLKRIARGELRAAFCYSEYNNGVDPGRFNLTARMDKEKKIFNLTAQKHGLVYYQVTS